MAKVVKKKTEKKPTKLEIMKGFISEEKKRAIKTDTDIQFGAIEDFGTTTLASKQPTGWLMWDALLDGWVNGRIIEIYGEESELYYCSL